MKIAVFGLGHVGCVSAGCLASLGNDVVGVDCEQDRVNLLSKGECPIHEDDLETLIATAVERKQMRATANPMEAVDATDLSLVCVGTPGQANGDLDLTQVMTVAQDIGEAIGKTNHYHTVVIRSTVLPGTVRDVIIPLLERKSGKRAGRDFGVGYNPEFLREGSAVSDFFNPSRIVVGGIDRNSCDLVGLLYAPIAAPLVMTSIEIGEMIKYADNAWHALKISFANEIGALSQFLAIDGHAVMDIFCQDTKLNLSASYLRPGFAFGGPCLPKDVRALTYKARLLNVSVPVLDAILASNRDQLTRAFQTIADTGLNRIGFFGLGFKAGTDDVRGSPLTLPPKVPSILR